MRKKLLLPTSLLLLAFSLGACTDDPQSDPILYPEAALEDGTHDDQLPTSYSPQNYLPSLSPRPYRPIYMEYSTTDAPINSRSFTTVPARILPNVMLFQADNRIETYKNSVNKYGSSTTKPRQAATGRFYVKKIDGRWWIVDPEGCLHYERSVTSLRPGSSSRNQAAWATKYGNNATWISETQRELAETGFHGTGAFCTDTYNLIQDHNTAHPDKPLTLAPSFGFIGQFKTSRSLPYPGNTSDNIAGLALRSDWKDFCKTYMQTVLAPYIGDPNTLGFFSDNEINFSTQGSRILDRFLAINTVGDMCYDKAKEFMASKGATTPTDALNAEFSGIVAEAYYKGVREALNEVDPGMMYLGTRLHGTPKYLEGVVRAAGKYCDIVSINYYSRWSPEVDYMVSWDTWADKPFLVTEFYTKNLDADYGNHEGANLSGAGFAVKTIQDKAYAYQHFTLGLLETKNCVGWHWFKYQDDDGADNSNKPAAKGLYDHTYTRYPYLARFMANINYNAYRLIDYFDGPWPPVK